MGMTRDDFLYHMAKVVSYPTWTAAMTIGILMAAGVLGIEGWLPAALVLMAIAMPIGVKLSRMELTKSMVSVFQTGILFQRKQDEIMRQSSERRATRAANQSGLLHEDVVAMMVERHEDQSLDSLAHDVIVVVRERVLSELSSYARENIR